MLILKAGNTNEFRSNRGVAKDYTFEKIKCKYCKAKFCANYAEMQDYSYFEHRHSVYIDCPCCKRTVTLILNNHEYNIWKEIYSLKKQISSVKEYNQRLERKLVEQQEHDTKTAD